MESSIKHYTASAIIFSDSPEKKVLLIKHRKFGLWLQPGGHQESWENPREAVIREVLEETGIDISHTLSPDIKIDELANELTPPKYFLEELIPGKNGEPDHYHLDQIYVVKVSEQPIKPVSGESTEYGWFSSQELEELEMFNNLRVLLKREMDSL